MLPANDTKGSTPRAGVQEPARPLYVGQVTLFPFSFAPEGWAPCKGQLLSIDMNQQLFALLGLRYGGNGTIDFALPDLPPLGPAGPGYFIALEGYFPSR